MSSSIQNISIGALIKCRPFTVFMDFFHFNAESVKYSYDHILSL